jgi:hypothetical protein
LAFQRGEDTPDGNLGAALTADFQMHVVAFIQGWAKGASAPKRRGKR